MKIGPARYRIADIAVYAGANPEEEAPSQPPAIAVEIVSRDDRHVDIVKRLAEYFGWGVPLVWLVDPWTRKLFHYTSAGLSEVRAFELPEYHARIAAEEIFS
ncbi:MAG: Uma2 family endonuclease [Candidatus Solibacter usitatus]|nr:Uma2 family endonuclease [Candidatus Solibacter usitatus]